MSKRVSRFGIVAIASFLLFMAAELPAGPMAAKDSVVVLGHEVNGNQVAVTLANPGESPQRGTLEVVAQLADGSFERVAFDYSLNGGSTGTYTLSFGGEVSDACEQGIIDDNSPM